ncbi:serine/threonine protein kinase [Tengunoibacter tsumagoiensis]|uniref:Protein kinase domain-containing protein n=1 Tax=Tengunoibacter tsumagoiensis TaxID=2014871 RepID=A0A401ZU89_9CHLR|nr:serine/threonine-protein kinase [Tengunoibacter tsumagoiensis]GCE10475.1 hypothetical protein KTT_03340 [Tengunoibacter tsumagoiensis]
MIQEHTILPIGAIVQGQNGERYVIEAVLGQGGFSAVYRVRERYNKQKIFALKEIVNPNPQERRNLAFEADLLMRLGHPSLPRVYQIFENTRLNRIFMLMDFIDGKNLEVLRLEQPDQRFSLSMALTLLTPVVEAISYLHNRKRPIVHRDIKPANIIVPAGALDAQLVDFGLAKEYIEDKTTNVFRCGTPGYAAPEQYGHGTNPRTDIYALGATLYTLLTGVVPVDALSRSVNQTDNDPYIPPDVLCPHLPFTVARIIDQAMHLRSDSRFASVEDFWRELCIATTHQHVGLRNRAQHKTYTLPTVPRLRRAALPQIPHLPQTEEEVEHSPMITPVTVRIRRTISTKHKIWLVLLLVLILIVAVIDGLFLYSLNIKNATNTAANTNSQSVVRNPLPNPSPDCRPLHRPPPFGDSPDQHPPDGYPDLCTAYTGTMATNQKKITEFKIIHLSHEPQSPVFEGHFVGMGQDQAFQSQMSFDVHDPHGELVVQFIVTLPNINQKLSFNGHIYRHPGPGPGPSTPGTETSFSGQGPGPDQGPGPGLADDGMGGTYQVIDQANNQIKDSGQWQIMPTLLEN